MDNRNKPNFVKIRKVVALSTSLLLYSSPIALALESSDCGEYTVVGASFNCEKRRIVRGENDEYFLLPPLIPIGKVVPLFNIIGEPIASERLFNNEWVRQQVRFVELGQGRYRVAGTNRGFIVPSDSETGAVRRIIEKLSLVPDLEKRDRSIAFFLISRGFYYDAAAALYGYVDSSNNPETYLLLARALIFLDDKNLTLLALSLIGKTLSLSPSSEQRADALNLTIAAIDRIEKLIESVERGN